MMNTVKIYEITSLFKPDYNEEDVKKITGGKEEMTALEILELDNIRAGLRLWVVLREEFIDASILYEFICRCVEETFLLVDEPDKRSMAAITALRKFIRKEISETELSAARKAAIDAKNEAEFGAMRCVAWAAVAALEDDLAGDVARFVSSLAARAATEVHLYAKYYDEIEHIIHDFNKKLQVDMLKKLLKEAE